MTLKKSLSNIGKAFNFFGRTKYDLSDSSFRRAAAAKLGMTPLSLMRASPEFLAENRGTLNRVWSRMANPTSPSLGYTPITRREPVSKQPSTGSEDAALIGSFVAGAVVAKLFFD